MGFQDTLRNVVNAVTGAGFFRNLENPSYPLSDPDDTVFDAFGATKSATGVRVNEQSAKQLSCVWRAVSLISGDVAKLPIRVFRREGVGKERDPSHAAFNLLRYKANRVQTAYQFRLLLQSRALLLGNGYALILRDNQGRPAELIPLPVSTHPREMVDGDISSLVYATSFSDRFTFLQPEDVIHIRGVGSEMEGDSVIANGRDSLGEGLAMQRYSGKFFANSAAPLVVLEHPMTLSPEAESRLKSAWKARFQGIDKSHNVAILQEGMKAHPWSVSMRDAEFIAGRKLSIREIANWFGVPPHLLGDETRTAFASLEQENQSYLDKALDPWLVNWEQELRDKLLSDPEKEQDSRVIEFERNALVRANLKDRVEAYNAAVIGGWMSPDEARARENLNPIPDGEGDVYFRPLNVQAVGENVPEPEPEPEPAPPPAEPPAEDDQRMAWSKETHVALIRYAGIRACRRLVGRAERAANQPKRFLKWLDSIEEERETMEGYLKESIEATNAALGTNLQCSEIVDTIFTYCRASMLAAAECKPAELKQSVKKHCDVFINQVCDIICEDIDEGS